MTAIHLRAAEQREHRAAAQRLQPVVTIGSGGDTPAVAKELDAALTAHGLVKVRIFSEDRAARAALLQRLAERLGAAAVQHIGKTLVLWRPRPEKTAEPAQVHPAGSKIVTLVIPSRNGRRRPTVKKIRLLGNERVTAGGCVKRAKPRQGSAKKSAGD